MKNIFFYVLALDIGVLIGKLNSPASFTYHLGLFN